MAGRYRRNGEAETLGCADCFWGCHLDHCFNDEMKPIPTNLKNTGGNRNESFA